MGKILSSGIGKGDLSDRNVRLSALWGGIWAEKCKKKIKIESDEEMLQMVHDALTAGAKGLSIGRNVFGHKKPTQMLQALNAMVHNNIPVQKAIEILNS